MLKWITRALLLPCALSLNAADEPRGVFHYAIAPEYSVFQAGFFPFRLCSIYTPVYGVSLDGLISIQEEVYGINLAPLGLYSSRLYGVSAGLFNICSDNYGLLAALCNLSRRNRGAMLGLVNAGSLRDAPPSGGAQIGLANFGGGGVFQAGLYNSAASGLQIGLVNYNAGSVVPWMLLVNFGSAATPVNPAE